MIVSKHKNDTVVFKEMRDKPLRVAAFCRCAGDEETIKQQWQYYFERISDFPKWTFMGCYASQEYHSEKEYLLGGFPQMMTDCEAGHIDLVFIKSISAFSRNTENCLEKVRVLKSLTPPVGVYFEDMNLYTLDTKYDPHIFMFLKAARQESEQKGNHLPRCDVGVKLLKSARTSKRMTQREVAERAGINIRQYQQFEGGGRDITNASFRIAMAVCFALDIDPENLKRMRTTKNDGDYLCDTP